MAQLKSVFHTTFCALKPHSFIAAASFITRPFLTAIFFPSRRHQWASVSRPTRKASQMGRAVARTPSDLQLPLVPILAPCYPTAPPGVQGREKKNMKWNHDLTWCDKTIANLCSMYTISNWDTGDRKNSYLSPVVTFPTTNQLWSKYIWK